MQRKTNDHPAGMVNFLKYNEYTDTRTEALCEIDNCISREMVQLAKYITSLRGGSKKLPVSIM